MLFTPVACVVYFALWAVFLVLCIGAWRSILVLLGKQPATSFPAGVPHGGDLYWRLNRAHLNTLENLPVFAALVWGALELGIGEEQIALFCVIIVALRMLQSTFHIISGHAIAVNLRFVAFVVQLISYCMIGYKILSHLM